MKELSIEEKAKRYDEAIEKFDVILNLNTVKKSGTIFADDVRKILPELKESEDERMIQYFKDLAPFDKADELYEKYGFSHKDAISWLEKLGGHAKFINGIQVGDKVTRNEDGVLVNLSQLNRVAKKVEKQGEQKPVEWSDEHKGLLEAQYQQGYEDGKKVHVNVEWSEEDRNKIADYLYCLNVGFTQTAAKQRAKDICDLLCPQKQWKPSDEQMITLRHVISGCSYDVEPLVEMEEQLKKLRGKMYDRI